MPLTFTVAKLRDERRRTNTVIFIPSCTPTWHESVIFFSGDISDFAFARRSDPLIAGDPEFLRYEFSLESISWTLAARVSHFASLILFKPNMMLGNFAIYSNFLNCDGRGNPRWTDMKQYPPESTASETLLEFMHSGSSQLEGLCNTDRLSLVAFSKGCVLLSAFLKDRDASLLSRVSSITYIDPGLHVRDSTFPFTEAEYGFFPRDIPIKVFVSPYQYSDPDRKWLRSEIHDFVKKSGASLIQTNMKKPRSLQTHFDCIGEAMGGLHDS